ncbi:hypothetical protein [Synechococcus sp. UW140]|uniref:hypothetical protein n=1 Tax=Synechococcus sp. UW140 TaxID=368503 RepID=UPI000E0E2476|nr:hypothetical protein [Synechococcus sp. UW140]
MLRRTFIGLTTTAGLALASLGRVKHAKGEEDHDSDQDCYINLQAVQTRDELIKYFKENGYHSINPLPLVTGVEFNGGLQFDDDSLRIGARDYSIQASARVEDLSEKNKPGALPLFHVMALSPAGGIQPNQSIDLSLKFLINQLGIVHDRLRVTGTNHLSAHLPLLQQYGIQESQIRFVDLKEARIAGKGSGYFEPKGHPRSPSLETYSIEYVLPSGQEIEIVEIGLDGIGLGLGIERLTMARHNQLLTWKQGLKSFRDAVQASAQRQDLPLPRGYFEILGLPQPDSDTGDA